eukprot:1156620-Pelagomonas_calceolata.AAC.5
MVARQESTVATTPAPNLLHFGEATIQQSIKRLSLMHHRHTAEGWTFWQHNPGLLLDHTQEPAERCNFTLSSHPMPIVFHASSSPCLMFPVPQTCPAQHNPRFMSDVVLPLPQTFFVQGLGLGYAFHLASFLRKRGDIWHICKELANPIRVQGCAASSTAILLERIKCVRPF